MKLFLRRRIILHITKILPKQKLYNFLNFQYHTLFNNPHVSVASSSLVSQVGASTLLLLLIAGNFKTWGVEISSSEIKFISYSKNIRQGFQNLKWGDPGTLQLSHKSTFCFQWGKQATEERNDLTNNTLSFNKHTYLQNSL